MAALDRLSVERNLSLNTLVREAVAELTEVPDPFKKSPRGGGRYEGNTGNPLLGGTKT
jgi:hypothetical protein